MVWRTAVPHGPSFTRPSWLFYSNNGEGASYPQLPWLMAQGGAGNYPTHPKTNSKCVVQLLLLDWPFLLKLAAAQIAVAKFLRRGFL